jgi:hypothetical protein
MTVVVRKELKLRKKYQTKGREFVSEKIFYIFDLDIFFFSAF